MSAKIWILISSLGLAACQPIPLAAPPPTPVLLQVQVASPLIPWRERLNQCAAEISEIGLVVHEVPEASLDLTQADLFLRLGDPLEMEGSAVLLGYEPLVVIVHPDNPLLRIQTSDLKAIYQGEISAWGNLEVEGSEPESLENSAINAWTFPEDNSLRNGFEGNLFRETNVQTESNVVPSVEAMLEVVSADPAAIGYLPAIWINDSVKALETEEVLTANFRLPVLGLTQTEPQGLVRDLLGCLQEQEK